MDCTAAVASPAFDSVCTAPTRGFSNLTDSNGRVFCKPARHGGEFDVFIVFELFHGVGKRHFPESVVVAVALPISGQDDKAGFLSGLNQPIRKISAVMEPASKCYAVREVSGVGDQCDLGP